MNPISFYLVTDTHYFESSLGAEGKAYEEYMKGEQFFLKESSAIVKSTFERLSEDKETDIVIIPGDLSKNGEKESHRSFIKELYKLKEQGKKIFVITAAHDYNEWSNGYKNDERIQVEGTSFEELYDMYYDFGYSQALDLDKQTLSYVAEVSEGVRMLAINCDSTDDTKGVIDDRMLDWAQKQIAKSKEDGCCMFAICHYPVIPSVPVFDLVGDAKVKQWRKVASFLADNGIELILTGHMHIQSINEFYSEKGNRLIDICTACLVGSPARYRKITINEQAVMKVESIDVQDFGWDMKGLSTREYFDKQFEQAIVNKVNWALSGGKGAVKHLKKLGKKIFNSVTVGGLARLLCIKVDKSLRKRKLTELVAEVGLSIFAGDQPYVEGTPIYDALTKVLKRFDFILNKVEPKLEKDGVKVNLREMLLNSIGNNKGFSDQNAEFKLSK